MWKEDAVAFLSARDCPSSSLGRLKELANVLYGEQKAGLREINKYVKRKRTRETEGGKEERIQGKRKVKR
jgi:hypothetical protein